MNNFFELLTFKIKADLIAEGTRNYLSFGWWILEPLITLAVYYLVFGVFLAMRDADFTMFLFVGIVAWQWFARTVNNAASSIHRSGLVISKVRVNKLFFPLTVIGTDLVKTALIFLVLVMVLLLSGYPLNESYLALPLVFFTQLALCAAVAIWVALLVPFVPDLMVMVTTLLLAMMFASGIFYRPEQLPPDVLQYFYHNPMALIIHDYRMILLDGQSPPLTQLMIITAIALLAIWLGKAWAHWFDRAYIRSVIR